MYDTFCVGVVESTELDLFPYGAQPLLCRKVGHDWVRLSYRLTNGVASDVREIGGPRPLDLHSFTFGDYVLTPPIVFEAGAVAIVVSPGRIVVAKDLRQVLTAVLCGAFAAPTDRINYVARGLRVVRDYRELGH